MINTTPEQETAQANQQAADSVRLVTSEELLMILDRRRRISRWRMWFLDRRRDLK